MRSHSRRRACLRCASSTRWITSRGRCSSSTCRRSSSNASAPNWQNSCARRRDSPRLRLVFAGTPQFAGRALERLMATAHAVTLVITRPDQPAGRGMRPAPSAVKRIATERGLELLQPSALADAHALERLHVARPDALVVAAYGVLLPRVVLEAARFGAINIHASLLPRWRGAAPIQRALLAGDSETGVSIMKMEEGLDTGPLYLQRRLAIEPQDDAGTLHDKLAALGADALVDVLAELERGEAQPRPQPESRATYARKVDKAETRLDWTRPATELERAIR